jgi:DNA-binding transcriptional regulator YiaG
VGAVTLPGTEGGSGTYLTEGGIGGMQITAHLVGELSSKGIILAGSQGYAIDFDALEDAAFYKGGLLPMTTRKKIPSIEEQARKEAESLRGWAKGETRFKATLVYADGSRSTAHVTRDELDAKLKRAQASKGIRADLELSQSQFARLLHAGAAAVQQWEQGRRAIPDPVFALAELARDIPQARRRLEATAAAMVRATASVGTQKRATA